MKQIKGKNWVFASMLTLLSTLLFSFQTNKGGEGFEIYLDSKLVVQQFNNNMNHLQSISLYRDLANSEITVKYFHCGRPGKNRTITIKDDNQKILKEWHYPDVSAANMASGQLAMSFKVADILGLQKKNAGNCNLYYSSGELPGGRLLATLVCENAAAKR
jgi:hypothetical protein